jgi:signal transduction histidine kinase
MNQQDKRTRLLVIDDNADFLAQLEQTGLADYFDTSYIPMTGGKTEGADGIAHVIQLVLEAKPDDLIMDVTLRGAGDSRQLLKALGDARALPAHCRIWLISQVSPQQVGPILAQFQKIDANVQGKLLLKPIGPRRLWAEITDDLVYEPDPQWQSFPLPLRVLSPKGKVLYANDHWKQPDFPDPALFQGAKERGMPPKAKNFTGSYFGEGKSGFTVHSFALEQEGQEFVGQVAEVHPLEPALTNLEQTLDRIFETMKLAGYHYGRFYRVHRLAAHKDSHLYDRVLELDKLSYPGPAGLTLPYRLPLRGEWKRRFDEYKYDSGGRLDYRIRTREDDARVKDDLVDELNWRLGLETLDSWLEVPVWVRRTEGARNGADQADGGIYDIAGWLFFDRRRKPGDYIMGATDDQVTEENVQPVVPLLSSLVTLLAAAIRRERLQDLADYEDVMRQLDKSLAEEVRPEPLFGNLLNTLCQLSGARSGILMVKDDFGAHLRVAALKVGAELAFLRNLVIPLNADYHPIVQAWGDRTAYAFQAYKEGAMREALMQKLSAIAPPEHIRRLDPQDRARFTRWIEQDIGALLAIPILLPPDHRIGAISLEFDQPYSVTRRRLERTGDILHRARWLIQQYQDEKQWRYWQGSLGHELKTFLTTALQEINVLGDQVRGTPAEVAYRQARLHVLAAHDLAENWMDSHHETAGRKGINFTFRPFDDIDEYLRLSEYRIELDCIDLYLTPPLDHPDWRRLLRGDPLKFGRVVRVLLDNAFKYGLAHAGGDPPERVLVALAIAVDDSLWTLRITNPGQMDPESYRMRFLPGSEPGGGHHGGAHVGLAVAKHWTEVYEGNLSLENLGDDRVQACLSWPLAGDRASSPK